MEAANKGSSLADSESIGFNASLPFEQITNRYFSPELNFEFHYFFMRMLWFVDLAEALIAFPDGYGTCDELMEVRALIQTGKIQKKIPILLYGREYWDEIINFVAMLQWNMVSPENLDLFQFVDSPEEAVSYIQRHIKVKG